MAFPTLSQHNQRAFEPADSDFEQRVRESFAQAGAMKLIGARLGRIEPGYVELDLDFRPDLTQQHGFLHAGITGSIADAAGGCAALTLFGPGESEMSTEFKINLIAPADGERFRAVGRVVKSGRTLTICELEVLAFKGDQAKTCAFGVQTLIRAKKTW